jgi:hypothetical protein
MLAFGAMAGVSTGCAMHRGQIQSAGGEVSPTLSTTTVTTVTPTPLSALLPPSDEAFLSAYMDDGMDLTARVNILDSRAALIDDRLPGMTNAYGLAPLALSDVQLTDDAFSDVTSDRWARMELLYDGNDLRKVRMVPDLTRDDTEEFYYDNGHLIMVYWNPNGIGAQDMAYGQVGESYYFGQEGLISWVSDDGTTHDSSSADFKYWNNQLQKEAARFPNGSK